MAFQVNVRAALIFVVAIPLLSIVVFGILLISMPLYKKVQKQLDRVLLTTRENLLGARVVRAFNRQQDEMKKFDEENSLLVNSQVFVGKISALMNPVTYVIVNGATIILIWTGAWQVEGGIITQGAVVALVNYMSQILVELVKLANLIITISKSLACANRISAVFEETSSIEDKADAAVLAANAGDAQEQPAKVEFASMDFAYAGSSENALSQISFRAMRGQTIGIIGGTGSGKSTLVNLIPRFYDATEGSVKVDGVDVRKMTQKDVRDRIGYVPQKGILFSGTIDSNIRYGKTEISEEAVKKAAGVAQATEFIDTKPERYKTPIAQGGSNVSGGQKQRLSIARAIAKDPEIFIFDDSFSALDFKTDSTLRKALKEHTKEATTIIVAQRISTILNADKILVLDDGHMAGIGSHKELMKSCEVYRQIAMSQLSEEELA